MSFYVLFTPNILTSAAVKAGENLTGLFPCFQASQPDELTIEEQEILEVIDDGDMEDWVKVLLTFYRYSSISSGFY